MSACSVAQSCSALCDPVDYSPPGFFRQGDLPDPGIEPAPLESPALAGGFFTTAPPGKPR